MSGSCVGSPSWMTGGRPGTADLSEDCSEPVATIPLLSRSACCHDPTCAADGPGSRGASSLIVSRSRAAGNLPTSSAGGRTYAAQMPLTQYYTATTIDGFIADEHNSLEWL